MEGRQRPKKPGPSLLQVASPVWRGSPVRLRLPVFQGRLTGLLSRSPPTDTRPQARAYWATSLFVRIAPRRKGFLVLRQTNSCDRRPWVPNMKGGAERLAGDAVSEGRAGDGGGSACRRRVGPAAPPPRNNAGKSVIVVLTKTVGSRRAPAAKARQATAGREGAHSGPFPIASDKFRD